MSTDQGTIWETGGGPVIYENKCKQTCKQIQAQKYVNILTLATLQYIIMGLIYEMT